MEDGRGSLSASLFGSEEDGALDDLSGLVSGVEGWGEGRFDNLDLDSSGMVAGDALERALLAEKEGAGGNWNGEERKALQEFAEWRDLLTEIQEGLTAAGIDARAAANREVSSPEDWKQVLVEVERVMNKIAGDESEEDTSGEGKSILDDIVGGDDETAAAVEDAAEAEEAADAAETDTHSEEELPPLPAPQPAAGDVDRALSLLPEGARQLATWLMRGERLASKREVMYLADDKANMPPDYDGDVYKWMGEQVEAALNYMSFCGTASPRWRTPPRFTGCWRKRCYRASGRRRLMKNSNFPRPFRWRRGWRWRAACGRGSGCWSRRRATAGWRCFFGRRMFG